MDVRRSRTVAAPLDDVWQIVRDPYHLPRWWPRTQRVEGVSSGGWTSVLVTDQGRSVRADYRVELTKSPASGGAGRRRSRGRRSRSCFREVVYEVALAPRGGGTEVGARGAPAAGRLGALRRRDAAPRRAQRQLDDALDGLAALLEAEA